MAHLGPFERRPRLAVAVSGGADSMALALLAARWAQARQGTVMALTVDHGLRAASAGEAAQVGTWLAARGIAHSVLPWTGPKPATAIQAAARAARYGLLLDRCRDEGILHLLVAHHRADQAETVALRRARGSGTRGLAAMAAVMPTNDARVLRPLLDVSKARLVATLAAMGQSWIEDPSNSNTAFERVRARASLAEPGGAGPSADELVRLAAAAAEGRKALDADVAGFLAAAAIVSPAGFVRVASRPLSALREPLGLEVLAAILKTVGGTLYPPRGEALARLWGEIQGGLDRRRSLAGCLIVPSPKGLLFCREPAAVEERLVDGGRPVLWDGRFLLDLMGSGPVTIAALGGHAAILRRALARQGPAAAWPAAVLATLPALGDDQGVAAVPHFGWRRKDFAGPVVVDWTFAPASPLTGGLVWHRRGTMC